MTIAAIVTPVPVPVFGFTTREYSIAWSVGAGWRRMRVGRGLQLADRGADEADRARVVFGSFTVLKFAGVWRPLRSAWQEAARSCTMQVVF